MYMCMFIYCCTVGCMLCIVWSHIDNYDVVWCYAVLVGVVLACIVRHDGVCHGMVMYIMCGHVVVSLSVCVLYCTMCNITHTGVYVCVIQSFIAWCYM